MSNFEEALAFAIKHEGTTFADDPQDLGGATKYGIAYKYHEKELVKYGVKNVEDLKRMPIEKASEFYKDEFWYKKGIDRIEDSKVASKLFDATLGFPSIVGQLGGIDALNRMSSKDAIQKIANAQSELFKRSVIEHPGNSVFSSTWQKRAADSPIGETLKCNTKSKDIDDNEKDACEQFFESMNECAGVINKLEKTDFVNASAKWLKANFNV